MRKRQIWVPKPHFWEVRSDARPWLMAHGKACGRLSVRVNWTFFAIYYGPGVTLCVQLGCFHRVSTSLDWNFTWTWSSPINHSWHWKTGLPDGEDRTPLRSLVLTQFGSAVDGQTDRQTERCKNLLAARNLHGDGDPSALNLEYLKVTALSSCICPFLPCDCM